MDIKNFFSGMFGGGSQNILHTPNGDFNLAKSSDRKRMNKMVIELQRTTDALTRKDIADWRNAWQMAINVDNPNRQRLYDIYRDVDIDLHLSGCVRQRVGFVMAKSFKLVDAKGNKNDQAHHYFDQAWFKQMLEYALAANLWGHSLIELGDITTDGDGCPCYTDVKLIPRKHVIPEYGRVIQQIGQDWTTGIDYRSAPFTDWLIEAGRPDDLGLYLKAATQTIPKKNMLAFWDSFGEIFGMPMRIARTTSRDPKEMGRLEQMLKGAGASQYMVAGQDTEIEFVESGKGDAFNVYDKRIDRANSELSKLIIGQTMTIEDGSSLSQSETHLEVFENLVESDCTMLRDIVNNQLIPRMVKHGFPVKGLRFEWDDAVDYTPEQQVAYETMVADRYEVDPSYFAEKYSMPVGERRNAQPMLPGGGDDDGDEGNKEPQDDDEGDKKKKQHQNAHSSFFD
uniref:phage portal protein family protein n=1 Tax=Alloprevotella sp. TaxID=1872471 RepID=UPI003FF0981F